MSAAFSHLFNNESERLFGVPSDEQYPWGKQSDAALQSGYTEESLLGDEARWWARARQLGIAGEETAAEWYRRLGYEVYDGAITVNTSQGIRYPDLAVRLDGGRWEFVEVKANMSPLIGSQVRKDRMIESIGFVGTRGPAEILGPQGPTQVNLIRVLIP